MLQETVFWSLVMFLMQFVLLICSVKTTSLQLDLKMADLCQPFEIYSF